ncbi:cupin domain-containing protein [Streptomyces vinaceus]|uniref:cupin domain-containing protein n=1 Tax=Streptomyces vinaceus TaxID=1960 RepID=UPI003801CF7D
MVVVRGRDEVLGVGEGGSPADAATVARAVPFEPAPGGALSGRAEDASGGAVEMLCGKYRLDRSRVHPLTLELPKVVHLPNRVGSHPELRAAISLLGGELGAQRPGACVAVPSLLDLLLVYMIRSWMAEGPGGAWSAVLGDPGSAGLDRAPGGLRHAVRLPTPSTGSSGRRRAATGRGRRRPREREAS